MKTKTKIIIGAVIVVILALAFFLGGKTPKPEKAAVTETHAPTEAVTLPQTAKPDKGSVTAEKPESSEKPKPTQQLDIKPTAAPVTKNKTAAKAIPTAAPMQDQYHTDPVPEGVPEPVEPQEVYVFEGTDLVCTLSVRCDTILDNLSLLDSAKRSLIPSDGVIYGEREVVFHKGESVFDVTLREMQNNKIHFEFSKTPIYNSAYIEGINNIYEFDCGELSGWEYSVNGVFPNYGCSRYQLSNGDRIEWMYTCDLGRDIGGHNYNE